MAKKDVLSPPSKVGGRKRKTSSASRKTSSRGRKSPSKAKTVKARGRKSGKSRSASRGARFTGIRAKLMELGKLTGQIGGSAYAASMAAGYFGDEKFKLMGKDYLDYRVVAAGLGTAAKLWAPLGHWSGLVTNVTTGVLSSWLSERGRAYGSRLAVPAAPPAPALQGMGGNEVVLGNIYDGDGVGDAEKRLERKLAKLRRKADKKGVAWKDVADMDESKQAIKYREANPGLDRRIEAREARWNAQPVGRRVIVPPWFLGARRRWRVAHPRR